MRVLAGNLLRAREGRSELLLLALSAPDAEGYLRIAPLVQPGERARAWVL